MPSPWGRGAADDLALPRDPDREPSGMFPEWNGGIPSARQLRLLAAFMATPVRSARYGRRVNAWRAATGRDPLTPDEVRAVQRMLRWRWRR